MTKPTNPEIELLVQVYRLILSWPESETADPEDLGREPGSAEEAPAPEERSAS